MLFFFSKKKQTLEAALVSFIATKGTYCWAPPPIWPKAVTTFVLTSASMSVSNAAMLATCVGVR